MARPIKTGLDYFPLDVTIDDDIELLEAEFGLVGFAIIVKLWQKIYSNGYYIKWEEDNVLLFSKRINCGVNEINSVINSCLRRNILNKGLFDSYSILTSAGIQKRYIKALSDCKRKSIIIISEYLLVNSEFTKLITELTPLNTEENTQSKGEESKGEEKRAEQIHLPATTELSFDRLIEIWNEETKENQQSYLLTEYCRKTIKDESKFNQLLTFIKSKGDLEDCLRAYINQVKPSFPKCNNLFAYAMKPSNFVNIWEYQEEKPVVFSMEDE